MSINQISKLTTYLDDTIKYCESMVKDIWFKILKNAGVKNAEMTAEKYANVYTYFVVNQTLNSTIGNHFLFHNGGDGFEELSKYGRLKFLDINADNKELKVRYPIKFNPGVYLNKADIKRETGLSLNTIQKALDFLEENDLIVNLHSSEKYQKFYNVDCSLLYFRYVNYGI